MAFTVPFFSRLGGRELLALLASFVLIGLEGLIRAITLALPERIIRFFYNQSRGLFNTLSSPASQRSRKSRRRVINPIAQAADFVDLCSLFGYYAEEHIVQTRDGYLLGLHRLASPKGREGQRVNAGPGSVQKRVVYLHHGLMMNSEVWVCLSEAERCLPFQLAERGYDVWLGNNRGNKYSKKSVHHSPTSPAFWDFSMDQFAFHDIPDTIDYVLSTTGQKSLSYVGFSQGTAQAFATLSIHPTLNDRVDVFVALAPAMSPPGLANGVVSSLVKASPQVLYLAFGRKSLLSSSTMWQSLLYPPIFVRCIDLALSFLFGWHTQNITQNQKLAAYPHLYSYASTKCVVHWFQIINGGVFQMFDDEVHGPMNPGRDQRYYKVAKFPTRNIKTPVVLVYGGADSLVDIDVMLKELPRHTVAKEIPHYEHLDFLWAADVHERVFPHVFEALEAHTGGRRTAELPADNHRLSIFSRQSYLSDDEPVSPSVAATHEGDGERLAASAWVNGSSPTTDAAAAAAAAANDRSSHIAERPGTPFQLDLAPSTPLSGPMVMGDTSGVSDESRSSSSAPQQRRGDGSRTRRRKHSTQSTHSFPGLPASATAEAKFGSHGIELGAGRTTATVAAAAPSLPGVEGAEWRPEAANLGRGRKKGASKQ